MAKSELEKNYNRKAKAFEKMLGDYRKVAKDYLKSLLEEHKSILFNYGGDNQEECVTISYDGGNHPEYASNVFSEVISVSLNNKGEITFEIEDSCDYHIDDVQTLDLYDTIHSINHYILPNFNEREKYVKRLLRKKDYDGVLSVSDFDAQITVNGFSTSVDTIVYDKTTKSLRYYAGDPTNENSDFEELILPLSVKQMLLSLVCDEY